MHVLTVFEKTTLKALQICKSVHPVLIKITIEGPRLAVTASEETPETVDPGAYGRFSFKSYRPGTGTEAAQASVQLGPDVKSG